MLAERTRLGLDRRDEMWEGVLHVVPQPSMRHQRLGFELAAALKAGMDRRGRWVVMEPAMFGVADDYKVPDVAVVRPDQADDHGIVGAPELVVEIRLPGDESDDKVAWYLARGARAVLIIDRDSLAVDIHGEGPEALGVSFHNDGPDALIVTVDGEAVRIEL
jgi:Uma2 family endonuclease